MTEKKLGLPKREKKHIFTSDFNYQHEINPSWFPQKWNTNEDPTFNT